MITAKRQVNPYVPEVGDIDVYGLAHHILPATDSLKAMISLDYFSTNPWDAAWKAGVDIISLKQQLLCPYSNLPYDAWVPTYISTDFPELLPVEPQWEAQIRDKDWTDGLKPDTLDGVCDPDEISSIVTAMLGTGYSLGRSPYDGYSELYWFEVELSNGSKLIGPGHVWFNK